ncbi:hypothetical protein MFLAVUS_007566 [Mucor flavus]|uniref:Uncharacterized protein n=1 Tax=Mucor flavus TaxID=439312 RepID=A0ABP9Z4N9_9FUNG
MNYAIMLTLCELDTAQIPIPNSCSSLSSETKNRIQDQEHPRLGQHIVDTFEMLANTRSFNVLRHTLSPRERTNLSSDILEKLHTNITLNQVKNFNILQQQQELLIEWRNNEFKTLDRLKESQSKVINQVDTIHQVHSRTADQIQLIFETLILVQNQTKTAVAEYNQVVRHYVKEMQTELNQLVIRQEFEVNLVIDTVISGLKTIDRNIGDMVTIQQDTTLNWSRERDLQNMYFENWTNTMDKLNTSVSQILSTSLESIQLLKDDILVIHSQLRGILIPFQWTIGVIMNFRGVFFNTLLYASFYYHMFYLFKSRNPFQKLFLSTVFAIGHQYIIHHIFSVYNENPNEEAIKILIVLVEWLLKKWFIGMRFGTRTPDRYDGSWSYQSSSTANSLYSLTDNSTYSSSSSFHDNGGD